MISFGLDGFNSSGSKPVRRISKHSTHALKNMPIDRCSKLLCIISKPIFADIHVWIDDSKLLCVVSKLAKTPAFRVDPEF